MSSTTWPAAFSRANDADLPNAELDFSSNDELAELPDDFAAQPDRFPFPSKIFYSLC